MSHAVTYKPPILLINLCNLIAIFNSKDHEQSRKHLKFMIELNKILGKFRKTLPSSVEDKIDIDDSIKIDLNSLFQKYPYIKNLSCVATFLSPMKPIEPPFFIYCEIKELLDYLNIFGYYYLKYIIHQKEAENEKSTSNEN